MKRYIIEIVYAVLIIVVSYSFMSNFQRTAKQVCNVNSYEGYVNTKAWCDLIGKKYELSTNIDLED